jgi:Holliday junction resolvase RusA-like endonuclease
MFEIPIKAKPFNRARSNGARRFDDAQYAEWKAQVGWHLKAAMLKGRLARFEGPLSVGLVFGQESIHVFVMSAVQCRPADQSADLDNLAKGVLDAANRVLFEDDRQVVVLAARFADEDRATLWAKTLAEVAVRNAAFDREWLEQEGIDADG